MNWDTHSVLWGKCRLSVAVPPKPTTKYAETARIAVVVVIGDDTCLA